MLSRMFEINIHSLIAEISSGRTDIGHDPQRMIYKIPVIISILMAIEPFSLYLSNWSGYVVEGYTLTQSNAFGKTE